MEWVIEWVEDENKTEIDNPAAHRSSAEIHGDVCDTEFSNQDPVSQLEALDRR